GRRFRRPDTALCGDLRVAPAGSALVVVLGRRERLLPTDVDEHRADLPDRDGDLEADLADRLGLARGRRVAAELAEELLEPLDLREVLLLAAIRHPGHEWVSAFRPGRCRRRAPRATRACTRLSGQHDVLGLGALLALGCVELDLRALGEGLEALACNRAVMDKEVLARVVRGDEPVPLRIVEPLDGSCRHRK